MVNFGPGVLGAQLRARKDYGVVNNVVLSNKLLETDIPGVPPPPLPLVGIGCGDRNVPDTSIEPRLNELLVTGQGDGGAHLISLVMLRG